MNDSKLDLFFDPSLLWSALLQALSEGVRNTLLIATGATAIGIALGLVIALMSLSDNRLLRWPARVYVDVLRGLPSILTIVLLGLGLPLAGLDLFGRSNYAYGILALGLISAAYVAEIFRAAIESVEGSQLEAARGLGLSHLQAMRLVIVPQAVRRVLPPLTNEMIVMIKDSSLVFVLGLQLGQRDVFRIGQNLAQQMVNYTPIVAAGIVYLLLTIPLTRVVNRLDARLKAGKQEAVLEEDWSERG